MQRLPSAKYRVDTGPLKIGDDWCGYFFRGDDLPTSTLLFAARLLDQVPNTDGYEAPMAAKLRKLAKEMQRCQER